MKSNIKNEIESLIKKLNLDCNVIEFKDRVNWFFISSYQNLSEEFIKEFKDKVNWYFISGHQKLSEKFIREFKDRVNWDNISYFQILSEEFIREFKDRVNWEDIPRCQKLSEEFIREFKDRVDWYCISYFQYLSEEFIREFKDRVDIDVHKAINRKTTREQKIKEMKLYAEKHKLKFDGKYLYAYRYHDNGAGQCTPVGTYGDSGYYRDWHLDMRKEVLNSFGLGIFPKGNTKVKVKINDWGLEVDREDGKCRVWGFEIIKETK